MSAPYWSVKHVGTLSLLPEKLTRGRAYFVDDEQIIIIDHGQGPVIYGGKPGPQGIAGEPSELVQSQIDNLADAALNTQSNIWYLIQRSDTRYQELTENISAEASLREIADDSLDRRISQEVDTLNASISAEASLREIADNSLDNRISQEVDTLNASINTAAQQALKDTEHYAQSLSQRADHLQEQVDNNSSAILSLISTLQSKFSELDSAIAILTKTISNLYPDPYAEPADPDPLDGETLTTDAGTWTIEQTNLEDGTIMLELTAQELLINTLHAGDKVDFDGSTWTVSSTEIQDGMITISLTQ